MAGPETDDANLVAAILAGDVDRFSEVVRRHDRRVRRVVAASVVDPDTREEIVQQSFYRAFRRLADLRQGGRLEPWLLAITRSLVAEHGRRHRPDEPLALSPPDAPPGPEWVWEEVARLDRKLSEVLVMRYRDRCSYAEIADRLGVPVSTVRGRIYEARRALRGRLEGERR